MRPTTRRNYARIHSTYVSHCHSLGYQPHPVSWQSLASFAVVLRDQQLKPQTIRAYISSVLAVEKLSFRTVPPELMEHLTRLFQGIDNNSVETHGVPALRPAISARDVATIASKILSMRNSRTQSMAAAVVLGFLFALRASTIVAIKLADIVVAPESLVLLETTRKSRTPRTTRRLEVPTRLCAPAATLWTYFSQVQSKRARDSWSSVPAFAFVPPTATTAQAQLVSTAMERVYAELGLQMPDSALTSHALRRGAAVSMHAVGVPLPRLLSWGAWQAEASVRPYLQGRAWQPATAYDRMFFQHMTQ